MLWYPSTWDLAGFFTVRKLQLLVTNQNTYAVFQANDERFEKTGKKGKGRPSSRPLPWKKRTAGWYVLFTNFYKRDLQLTQLVTLLGGGGFERIN